MTTARTFRGILRTATADESEQIFAFYQKANDPNVLPRPAEDIRRSAERGNFYVVEVEGLMQAAAGVFDLSPTSTLVEAGGCFVAPGFRGFGLQTLLLRVRLAAVAVNEGTDSSLISAVKPDNGNSLRNVMEGGFEPWAEPSQEVLEPCVTCPCKSSLERGRQCCCDFYRIPPDAQRQGVRKLLATDAWKATRRNGDKIEVTYICNLLTEPECLMALEEYVGGMTW